MTSNKVYPVFLCENRNVHPARNFLYHKFVMKMSLTKFMVEEYGVYNQKLVNT